MKKNMGNRDKIIRIALALVMIILIATDVVTGIAGYILLAVAIIFALTSFIGFCPIYTIFGIKTTPKKE